MKLLFDQNLSPRLVDYLSDLYPESNHVYRLGIDRVPDREVWEYARRESFVIVTKDADFIDLSMLAGLPTERRLDTAWKFVGRRILKASFDNTMELSRRSMEMRLLEC